MPSRKRSQGKARREARVSTILLGPCAPLLLQNGGAAAAKRCDHGFPPPTDDREVLNFVKVFVDSLQEYIGDVSGDSAMHPQTYMTALVGAVMPQLMRKNAIFTLANEERKHRIVQCLVSLATNYLLVQCPDCTDKSCSSSSCKRGVYSHMASTVALYIISSERMDSLAYTSLCRDLNENRERATVRFFSKRIQCSCLREQWQSIRRQQQIGVCWNCKEKKEGKELMYCARCGAGQYCSASCQKADWSTHREVCDYHIKCHSACDAIWRATDEGERPSERAMSDAYEILENDECCIM